MSSDFIRSRGSSTEEFYQLCEEAKEAGDDRIGVFVDLLTQVLEFQTFIDLCRDGQKVKYLKQIMEGYSKMLKQQQ